MDAEVAYADVRLDAWASWVKGNRGAWPSQTLLARIIEQGVSGAAQGGGTAYMPDPVLETDRAVARIDVQLRRVLVEYYLVYSSSDVKAAKIGVSRATFWRLVTRGQKSVARILNGETQNQYSQAILQIASA